MHLRNLEKKKKVKLTITKKKEKKEIATQRDQIQNAHNIARTDGPLTRRLKHLAGM